MAALKETRLAKLSLAGVEALLLDTVELPGLVCGRVKGLDLPDIGGVGLNVGYGGAWLTVLLDWLGADEVQVRPDRSSMVHSAVRLSRFKVASCII